MKQKLFSVIKIASGIFMTSALFLEVWYACSFLTTNIIFPDTLYPVFWLGSLAIVAHSIEGIIAAFKAKKYQRNFISYGIYTFFVGFVGLSELNAIESQFIEEKSA